jgi:Glutaredoxin-like domain (DUF836)
LCHELLEVARGVAASLGLEIEERNVADDPELEARYLFEIPVLLLDGLEVARHRATPEELRDRVAKVLAGRA